jgi:thioredoxin-like negative regulator of GroEL
MHIRCLHAQEIIFFIRKIHTRTHTCTIYVCMYVYIHTHTHTYIYVVVYIYTNLQKVIECKDPVIVCCIAEWCGEIAGVLAKAVGAKPGVKLGVLDAQRYSEFATNSLRIENLPTTYLFHNGKALDKIVGTMGQQQVTELVKKAASLLGKQEPDPTELMTEAGKLLTEGKVEDALQVYMSVLQQSKDKHGASAYAGMALCALAVQGY